MSHPRLYINYQRERERIKLGLECLKGGTRLSMVSVIIISWHHFDGSQLKNKRNVATEREREKHPWSD